jgi:probable rRNA maturation factor
MDDDEPERCDALLTISVGAGWRRFIPRTETLIRRAIQAACGECPWPAAVILSSDREVRSLNRRYRGKNKPTNVLSFPSADGGPEGEIIIALGVTQREARQMALPVAAHMMHLIVHALLHLQGHDHYHPSKAREMEMRETRILHRLGLANPWKRGRIPL